MLAPKIYIFSLLFFLFNRHSDLLKNVVDDGVELKPAIIEASGEVPLMSNQPLM
jgi:hypothetical protein